MKYSNKYKKALFEKISSLSSTEHEEILKIIKGKDINFSQNKNGVFFNLSVLEDDVIEYINNFVEFCLSNKKDLDEYDKKLNDCKINNNFDTIMNISLDKMEKLDEEEFLNKDKDDGWESINTLSSKKTQRIINFIEKMTNDKDKCVKKKTNVKFHNARKKYSKKVYNDRRYDDTGLDGDLYREDFLLKSELETKN
jgi:hypothetical protein